MRKKMLVALFVMFMGATAGCGGKNDAQIPTWIPTINPTEIVVPTVTQEPVSTATPTVTSTPMPTNTPIPTATNTPMPTNTPIPTATSTPMPTNTPIPTATSTPTPTNTPIPTATSTPTPTNTPIPTATSTPTPTNTPTPTPIPKPEFFTSVDWEKATVGDRVRFGAYEQDNDTSNGKEVIEWVVVDETEEYFRLFCPTALAAQQYTEKEGLEWLWEDSLVRTWLNETFYQEAFSEEEKKKIALTQTDHWFQGNGYSDMEVFLIVGSWVEDDTMDYVVLPDGDDIGSIVYGRNQNIQIRCSDYARTQNHDKGYMGEWYTTYWTSDRTEDGYYGTAEIDKLGGWIPSSMPDPTKSFFVLPVIWVAKEGTAGIKTSFTDEGVFQTKASGDGVIVTGVTDKNLTEVYVPATIDGKKVVEIAENAFSKCKKLARIKLPENLKTLDVNAFKGCDELEDIFLPSTLEQLDEKIYTVNSSLENILYAKDVNTTVKQSVKNIKRAMNYENNKEIWEVIDNDEGRFGIWKLTYKEYIEIYNSIGTENDLFLQMLKERGPGHTEDYYYYDFDGVQKLDIVFESVTAEKIYALHYAPFNYNHEDLEGGSYGKSREEAYQEHGGVCSILANTYLHFIKEILGENDWKYALYSNGEVNHEVLLIKTEDGRVFQIDNAENDYWWLGINFKPDYSKIDNPTEESKEVVKKFEEWKEDISTIEKLKWFNFRFFSFYDFDTNEWTVRRPIWYNFETGEYETYLVEEIPKAYIVTCPGLPGKIISMAGHLKLEGYKDLSELKFK